MKKFLSSFLQRFKKKPPKDEPSDYQNDGSSQIYSDENPEEFVEKTLNNINLDKFRAENQHLINDNLDEDENENENTEYAELPLPEKPKEKTRNKFKFPKFDRKEATGRFKARLAKINSLNKLDSFSSNDFILKFFSPYSRGKIHAFFIIFSVAILTYLLGKGSALFLNSRMPPTSALKSNIVIPYEITDSTLQGLNQISTANLFNIKESDKSERKKETLDIANIVCTDAEKPSAEPLKLLDTIVLQDSVKSVASVQMRESSELINVREGEELNNTVLVSKITRMKIILKNLTSGECEYIASDEEAEAVMPNIQVHSEKNARALFKSSIPEIKNNGNSFKIKKSFRDKMINNMSEVLTQAKAIQITNPDGTLSFKMTDVVPGSIYSNLNIQNDDIINSINGKKIENLNELMGLLGRIKEIDQFQIGLKRNGVEQNLEYGIE